MRRHTLSTALVALLVLFAGAPAGGWTRATHVEIARQAATIAPPDLFRQIKRHEREFVAGLAASLPARHESSSRSSGEILTQIKNGAEATVKAIEEHRPFREIVHHLGRLAIYAADANNPLVHSASDPDESRYRVDYERYVAAAQDRFPVVFYGQGRDVRTERGLVTLIGEMKARSGLYYPLIGREYRRIGTVDGVRLFDDKSTAFGVASIAFSHAVSDLAAIYRYVWLEAGGGDGRNLPITAPVAASRPPTRGTRRAGR